MADKHQREQEIFNEALERAPTGARLAFVKGACGDDHELREGVEALLEAYSAGENFIPTRQIEGPVAGNEADRAIKCAAPTRPSADDVGVTIGRYKLLEKIGEGGFGAVYVAEQTEPVQRRVALKVIKLGMDTQQVVARFEAERQALALMEHPNIAKVLDAGSTDTGRPFFVMELVRGIRITDYCDQNQLTTKQRLDLFIKVCQAVQHAHQKGIIHRDLKPSNILVTLHDGVPVPKVIDFGIAKATAGRLTDAAVYTQLHQFIGTPAYMSPEQAEISGLDIDTRSDIYSLGVLLYELLTGKTPFDPEELLQRGLDEMRRTIREKEPVRPSTRLATLQAADLTTTAKCRSCDAPRLILSLRGDLDWVVMKCLEKDRRRRYETANGLAKEIMRHLADEPVTAGAPSQTYRFQKFVRRNKEPVIAAAAVLTVLIAGIIGTTIGLVGQARQRAEAQRQAAIAKAVAQFQSDMLGSADPNNQLGDKVTVFQAIMGAAKELDAGKLKDQPLVEASVRQMIGLTLRSLGRYDLAEPNLRKNVELCRQALPAEPQGIAESLNALALLLLDMARPAEAEPLFREAMAICRKSLPAGHEQIAQALNNLALALQAQGKFAEAEALYREATGLRRQALPAGHPDIALGLHNLALALRDQGRFSEAEPLSREALEIRRQALPAGHPDIAQSLNGLALLLRDQVRFVEAEPLAHEALAISRTNLPALHPHTAQNLNNLALTLQGQGRLAEAESLYREALEIRRKVLPAAHPDIALGLHNLGLLLRDLAKFSDAEPLCREALEIRRETLPAGHPDVAQSLNALSLVLRDQNRFAEAEPLARETLEICRTALPAGHPYIATSLNNVAWVLQAQGRLAEAEPLYGEALDLRRKALPAGHPDIVQSLNNLALLLRDQGKLSEAAPFFRELLATVEGAYGKESGQAGNTRLALGRTLTGLKRYAEAEVALVQAERVLSTAQGIPAGRHDKCVEALAVLYAAWDKSEPGKGYSAKAEQWKGRLPAGPPEKAQ